MNKAYPFIPEKAKLLAFTSEKEGLLRLTYIPKPRLKVLKEEFFFHEQLIKGYQARGNKLSNKEVKKAEIRKTVEAKGVVSTISAETP